MNDAELGGKVARKRSGKTAGHGSGEPDFEASLRRLEAIVGRLEAGELPLEETLRLFEEGQALVRGCSSLLERAEQRVKELVEGTGEIRDLAISGAGGASTSGEIGATTSDRVFRDTEPAGAPFSRKASGGATSGGASSGGTVDREGVDA